jgi:hypothetical protein
MSSSSNQEDIKAKSCTCSKCGKECKNKRGLHIHEAACSGSTSLDCEGCHKQFSSIYVLQRHIPSCPVLEKERHDKAVEEQVRFIREEYERRIHSLETEKHNLDKSYNLRLDSMIKETKDECKKYIDHIDILTKQVNDLTHRNQDIEDERKMLTRNMLDNWNKTTSLMTHSQNIQVNNNQNNSTNMVFQSFNYGECLDKIKPPDFTVFSVGEVVNLLFDSGFGNYIRTPDRSRGVLLWNNPEKGHIRDSNGSDLSNYLIDCLQPKIETQQHFVEQELNHLIATNYPDDDLIEAKRKHIEFCKQIRNKDQKLLNKLRKEIGRRVKDVNDHSVDPIKKSRFNKILLSIESKLYPLLDEWISMSLEEFGLFLGRKTSDLYWIEGASPGSDENIPYIVVRDDNKKHCKITYFELGDLLNEALLPKLQSDDNKEIVSRLIDVWLLEKNRDKHEEALKRHKTLVKTFLKKDSKPLNIILSSMIQFKRS